MLLYSLGGILLGLAWIYPGSLASAALGAVAAFLLIYATKKKRSYFASWAFGLLSHGIAFYWLFGTIKNFGGYNWGVSSLFFALFIATQSLIFPLFTFLYSRINFGLQKRIGISATLAWLLTSFLFVRIFPWDFSHTMSAVRHLTQIADIAGDTLITALVIFCAESLSIYLIDTKQRKLLLFPIILLLATITYSTLQINYYGDSKNFLSQIKTTMIQGDVSIQKKGNMQFLGTNLKTYWEASKAAINTENPELVIWPESVITQEINVTAQNLEETGYLPDFTPVNFLTGALSFDSRSNVKKIHNSAFGINTKGQIFTPYHKQILMPFGEYIPFSNLYPKVKELAPFIPDFTAGEKVEVFPFNKNLKVAPLICYEDLLPSISQTASQLGATLLVNLTNDAWFGRSVASRQHNLIASFRAIENRRFLLRSTNSGLTSIVDPTGKTTAELPIFTTASLSKTIGLLNQQSIFSKFSTNRIWWLFYAYAIICLLYNLRKRS